LLFTIPPDPPLTRKIPNLMKPTAADFRTQAHSEVWHLLLLAFRVDRPRVDRDDVVLLVTILAAGAHGEVLAEEHASEESLL